MGSLIARSEIISNLNFKGLKPLISAEDFAEALSKGSKHGGVSAIIDEIPYIKAFLAKYPDHYSMIKSISSTNGFGFVSNFAFKTCLASVKRSVINLIAYSAKNLHSL